MWYLFFKVILVPWCKLAVVETMQSSGRVVKRLNTKLPSYINTPCNRPVYMRTTFSSFSEKMKIFGLIVFFRTFFLISCRPQDSASESLHPKERWMLRATPDQIELVKSSRGRFFQTRCLPYKIPMPSFYQSNKMQ